MVTLAHLSDVHLAPLPHVPWTALMNKRITGYLNWVINRRGHMHSDTVSALVEDLRPRNPDLVAVSGDLVNLALRAEIERSAEWLKTIGPAEQVAVIPGNHDAYVPGAVKKCRKAWGEYGTGVTLDDASYPFVRRAGPLALIGCSSAIATPPFFAKGRFGRSQAQRLERMLTALGEEGTFRTVMIHHPPQPEATSPRLGLDGAERFRDVIARAGAELILHGHLHQSIVTAIPGPSSEVPVIGVAAASTAPETGHPPARYNFFEIEKLETGFSCVMHEYGFEAMGESVVHRLELRLH
ncbi:metallophosphoesterase family protein [Cucumibacter marinus]|uniref:metallophosphoesterase family protein n=1 Tax=Cucumibacter marinus TaxID=1121252 RepID=UPI00048C8980|nr:metallophosphoesterase [Cucumibacter marinus]